MGVTVVIASSVRNLVEERVCLHSMIQSGTDQSDIVILDADESAVFDASRSEKLVSFDFGILGQTTSFTLARLFVPLILADKRLVVIDPDTLVFSALRQLFPTEAQEGLFARRAYARNEWASSVLGIIKGEGFLRNEHLYEAAVRTKEISWQDKIYLRPIFSESAQVSINSVSRHWNSFDTVGKSTKLLHYTNLLSQPWSQANHPYEDIWFEKALEAFEAGILTKDHIEAQSGQTAFYDADKPLLRSDFNKRLFEPEKYGRSSGYWKNHARLFVENLKFHSPKKFLFNALIR